MIVSKFFQTDAVRLPYVGSSNVQHCIKVFDEIDLNDLADAVNTFLTGLDDPDPAAPQVMVQDIQYQPVTFGGMKYTAMLWITTFTQ